MSKAEWWPALQTLGSSKPSRGDYRVIDLSTGLPIASTSDPDHFMLENGIPNLAWFKSKLTSDIQRQLDNQIKQSCIDGNLLTKAKDGHSCLSHQIPSDESVQSILKAIGFKHSQAGPGLTQVWSSSDAKCFDSLDHVRVFVRKSTIISRYRISAQQDLSLRIWAALSPEPVAMFDLKRYQDMTTPLALDDHSGRNNNSKTSSSQSPERGQSESSRV
jgi:hypothetical protein